MAGKYDNYYNKLSKTVKNMPTREEFSAYMDTDEGRRGLHSRLIQYGYLDDDISYEQWGKNLPRLNTTDTSKSYGVMASDAYTNRYTRQAEEQRIDQETKAEDAKRKQIVDSYNAYAKLEDSFAKYEQSQDVSDLFNVGQQEPIFGEDPKKYWRNRVAKRKEGEVQAKAKVDQEREELRQRMQLLKDDPDAYNELYGFKGFDVDKVNLDNLFTFDPTVDKRGNKHDNVFAKAFANQRIDAEDKALQLGFQQQELQDMLADPMALEKTKREVEAEIERLGKARDAAAQKYGSEHPFLSLLSGAKGTRSLDPWLEGAYGPEAQSITLELEKAFAKLDNLKNIEKKIKSGELPRGGFWNGVGQMGQAVADKVTDRSWGMYEGMSNMLSESEKQIVFDKIAKGEPLTASEMQWATIDLLEGKVNTEVDSPYLYNITSGLMESAPYMRDILLSPGKGISGAFVNWGKSRYGATGFLKLVGNALQGAATTATVGADELVSGTSERMRGDLSFGENGLEVTGQKSLGRALTQQFASQTASNMVELMGVPLLDKAGKYIGKAVKEVADGLSYGKVSKVLSAMDKSSAVNWVNGVRKSMGIHSLPAEIGEEYVDGFAQSIVEGEDQLSPMLNTEEFLNIAGTCGLMSAIFGSANVAGFAGEFHKVNREFKKAKQEVLRQFSSDVWASLDNLITNAQDEDLTVRLADAMDGMAMNQEQRSAITNYLTALKRYQKFNELNDGGKFIIGGPQAQATQSTSTYEIDSDITLKDEIGNPIDAHIIGRDANGNYMVESSQPINGKRVQPLSADQLDAMVIPNTPDGIQQSEVDGYNLTDANQQAEVSMLTDNARESVATLLGVTPDAVDATLQQVLGDNPTDAKIDARFGGNAQVVKDYMYNVAKTKGMSARLIDDIADATAESDRAIDAVDNNGNVVTAKDAEGNDVNVVSGNIVTYEDNQIDVANSDASVVIRHADGTTEMVVPTSLTEVVSMPTEQAKTEQAQAIAQQMQQAFSDKLNGALDYSQGQQYTMLNADGSTTDVTILADNGDGNVTVTARDGNKEGGVTDGKQIVLPKSQIQQGVREFKRNQLRGESAQQASIPQAEAQPTEVAEPTQEPSMPTDEQGNIMYEQMDADSAWDRLVAESGDDVDIATMVVQSNIEDAQKALDKAKKQTPKLVGTTEEKLAIAKAFKESVVKAQNDLAKWQEIADVPKRRASLQTEQTDLQTESQGQQVTGKLPASEEVGPTETTPVEEVAQIEKSAPIEEQTKGNVSTMSQETDQVSDQVEEEKDVIEELRERNRVGNERDQRAGRPPRPSDYIEAIGKGDDKAMKAWEGEFNDYAQKLNADDLPDIESTIRQMQGHIDTIRSGNPKGYKDNSAYKAYSGIKKMFEKRKRELNKQSAEDNTRLSAMSGVGLVEDARTRTLGDKTRKMLDAMAKRLGLQVEFVDEIVTGKDEKGRNTYANADIVGNKVRIAWDKRDQALDFLLGHEFTHRMQNLSPEAYAEFVEAAKQALGEEEWNKRINRMKSLYKQHGIAISEQGIIDEVVADYAGELVEERGVFDNFVERNKENRGLLSKIADVLRSIKEFFTLGKQRKINNAIARLEALIESASEANVRGDAVSSEEQRNSLIGEQGATALDKAEEATHRMDNLAVARDMEAEGKDAKSIRMATGWERGADGKWRYEIEDIGEIETPDEAIARMEKERKAIEKDRERLDYVVYQRLPRNATEEQKAKMKELRKRHKELVKKSSELWNAIYDKSNSKLGVHLSEYIGNDNELLKAYPELRNIDVSFVENSAMINEGFNGSFNGCTIWINPYAENARSILIHEIQHAIQNIEGFAKGGNNKTADMLRDKARVWAWRNALIHTAKERPELSGTTAVEKALIEEYKEDGLEDYIPSEEQRIKGLNLYLRGYDNEGYEQAYNQMHKVMPGEDYTTYRRLAGEVESRNAQKRMDMTAEQRRETLLSETEDVAREDQIFLMENGGVSGMGSTVVKRKADIAMKLKGKDISPTQLKVVDAFATDTNNLTIDVVDTNGKQRSITLKQGQDNKAGVKHSVLKHYETASNYYTAEEILLIPQIIEKGERIQNGNKVSYKAEVNGVKLTVTTEMRRGNEEFTNFFTNRKPINKSLSNTAKQHGTTSQSVSADKGSEGNSDTQENSAKAQYSLQGNSMTEEEQRIVDEAKANGTYLKAPKGKASNLNERQWIQVRTKAFKDWFGDWENDPENASKVVDENGEPKVVYHQTNKTIYRNVENGKLWDDLDWREKQEWEERDDWDEYWVEEDFYEFSRTNARTTNEFDGFFFAPKYDEYHEYGDRTIEAFLNIRKPASHADYKIDAQYNDAGKKERIRLQEEGYDGVIRMEGDEVDEYIAFEPTQIKSATDNVGTFDASNPDIRYSLFGGNSGYVGYSMSKRAARAREEGRYPKTDFRKEYGVTAKSFDELVDAKIIASGEWHHTSKFGNETKFYHWDEDYYADIYEENKAVIDKLSRERKTDEIVSLFENHPLAHKAEYDNETERLVDDVNREYNDKIREVENEKRDKERAYNSAVFDALGQLTNVVKTNNGNLWFNASNGVGIQIDSAGNEVSMNYGGANGSKGALRYEARNELQTAIESVAKESNIESADATYYTDKVNQLNAERAERVAQLVEAREKEYTPKARYSLASDMARDEKMQSLLKNTPLWNDVAKTMSDADDYTIAVEVLNRLDEDAVNSANEAIDNANGVFAKADATDVANRLERALQMMRSDENAEVSEGGYGGERYSLSSSNKSINKYDKTYGTDVKGFFDYLKNGKKVEPGKPSSFYIANAGELLEKYGIKGKFMVGDFTFSRTHTDNEDHNLGINEWVKVINNLNNPLAITRYKGLDNSYRIYTKAMINGKNICVGVDVATTNGEIKLSRVVSAYGRDIANVLKGEKVNLVYPEDIKELEQTIQQGSTAHNSLLNADSSALADKGNANSSDVQAKSGKGAKFSLQGGRSIADKYEKKVNTKGKGGAMHLSKFNFMEAWQDEMRALKEVQRIIEQEYGIVLESYEDAYMAENAMSSIAKASWDRYINEVYEPMMRIHDEWIRSGESNESINHYLIAKSGLERNREFTVRDAFRAERASMEEPIRDAYRSAIKDLNEKYKPMELDLLNQYRSGAIDKDTYRNERKNLSDAKKAERKPIDDKYQLDMQDAHDKMTQVEEEYKAKRNALRDDLKAGNIGFAEFCRLSDDLALQYSGAEEIADYSGLTALAKIYGRDDFYNFAMGMVDAFERRHSNTDVMWEHINNNTKAAVDYSYKSGITSKQAKEHLDQMFVWYVPMKGNADVEAEDIYTYVNDKSSSFTPTVARAKGHTKYVSEDVMALIANTMQSAILQGERNKVKQKFLNMVQNYPTDLFSVDNGWVELQGNDWVEVFPDINENDTPEEVRSKIEDFQEKMQELANEGKAKRKSEALSLGVPFRATQNKSEHAISVMRNGEKMTIYVNGNPRVAQAINGKLKDTKESLGMRLWHTFTRWLSAGMTGYSIDFTGANLSRDTHHSSAIMFLKYGFKEQIRYILNGFADLPALIRGISGKSGNSKRDAYFQEFLANGGETGYANLRSLDDWKVENKRRIGRLRTMGGRAWGHTRNVLPYIAEAFGYINRLAETSSRFNAYVRARERNQDVATAVSEAKNITVNFNKKGTNKTAGAFGTLAKLYRETMMFANPVIQGLYQFLKVGKEHKSRFTVLCLGHVALGGVVPILNQMLFELLGGDEEDEYYNQSEYQRRTNLLIYTGHGYIKIPLAPIFRELYALGDVFYGVIQKKIKMEDGAKDVVGLVRSMFSIEGQSAIDDDWSLVRFILPEQLSVVADISDNVNFMGMPIYKDSDYLRFEPEYKKVYKNAWTPFVEVSAKLNELLGGDEDSAPRGVNDKWLNPAIWQHVISSIGGGPLKTIGDVLDITDRSGEDLSISNIPVAKRFFMKPDERTLINAVNNDYYKLKEDMAWVEDRVRKLNTKEYSGYAGAAEKLDFMYHSPDYLKYIIFKDGNKEIEELDKEIKTATDEDEIQNLKTMSAIKKDQLISEIEAVDRILKGGEQASEYDSLLSYHISKDIVKKMRKRLKEIQIKEVQNPGTLKAYKKTPEYDLYVDINKSVNAINRIDRDLKDETTYRTPAQTLRLQKRRKKNMDTLVELIKAYESIGEIKE